MRSVQLLVALSFFACCQLTSAATRHVPGDYSTIQAAINASVAGDVVELADGVFTGPGNGDLDFHGKAIVVRSSSGNPSACVIDGQYARRGFYFHSSETAASVVANVGIRAGYGIGAGGIRIVQSSPTITGCVLSANLASGTFGGAVEFIQSRSRLEDCLIAANSGGGQPAGLAVTHSPDVLITGCVIRDHVGGQGIFVLGSHASITDCTIVRNELAGITVDDFYTGTTVVDVDHTIVALNAGPAVRCLSQWDILVTASCCDFHGNGGGNWTGCVGGQGNIQGNFSLDPLFCDPVGGDFFLYTYSPCAPPGATGCGLVGALGVGCGPVSTEPSTWGRQKSLFR